MITTNTPSFPGMPVVPIHRDRLETYGRKTIRLDHQEKQFRLDDFHRELLRHSARKLAEKRHDAVPPGHAQLLDRLMDNARVLQKTYEILSQSVADGEELPPANQWLLDNFHIIQEQIETARTHLLQNGRRRFSKWFHGERPDTTPMYEVAREIVVRLEGRVDWKCMHEFIASYQQAVPLTHMELWAIPPMLRLALIEYLCPAALGTSPALDGARQSGDEKDRKGSNGLIQDSRENAVRNCILSLQILGSLDWKKFIESQDAIERILRQDSAGVYERMDFFSRDHYLHIVEKLARRSGLSEEAVARKAVELARQAGRNPPASTPSPINDTESVQGHVGYYLLGQGRRTLEKRLRYRPEWREKLARAAAYGPTGFYLGAIFLVWLLTVAGAWSVGTMLGIGGNIGPVVYAILVILSGGIAAQFAVQFVDWLCTLLMPPRPMMRLDFSQGIPEAYRTLVAVPTMLTSEQSVRQLVRQLEVRYAANRDENLFFALATDFPDAAAETMPNDESLVTLACEEVKRLNEQYCCNRPAQFYLLHRPRKWNPEEGVWMGEERKRGKLAALNRLLLRGDSEAFNVTVGDLGRLVGVRYVITLDTDTQLPPGAGRKLVGRMAHPLNRARFDFRSRQFVEGFAIIQPRVSVAFPDANRTPYSRLLAGDAGIDPYTGQTSHLYHDLFAQSSFIGKGIYDVEAFEKAVAGQFPDNRILSHDLIESCFAPCGFANDVELFEGVPARLLADANRRHRWIRGDWQIAAWLMPKIPTVVGTSANRLSWLSRWKIFDNLRRSLTPLVQLSFLLLGWVFAPTHALFLMVLALLFISGLPCVTTLWGFFRKPEEKPWLLHLKDRGGLWLRTISTEAIAWCILPFTAYCHLDAIARVLYRMHISRRKNLEWTTSSDAETRCNFDLAKHYRVMWPCTIVALVAIALVATVYPFALLAAAPMLIAWLAGPWIAWRVSQPLVTDAIEPTEKEKRQLRRWARQTWHYFELHADENNHGLPPDNVQEDLDEPVVGNTSPTNIGLGLVSGLAAYDFGYLPGGSLLKRTGRTLKTLRRLKRYRGHFYNWYNTRTLQPIEPKFISSVDSGNLWGSLVVLRGGLEELRDRPLVSPRLIEGLQDTLEVITVLRRTDKSGSVTGRFDMLLSQLRDACRPDSSGSAIQACKSLKTLHKLAVRLNSLVRTPVDHPFSEPFEIASSPCLFAFSASALEHHPSAIAECSIARPFEKSSDLKRWTQALVRQIAETKRELSQMAFWIHFPLLPLPQEDFNTAIQEVNDLYDQLCRWDERCSLGQLPEAASQTADRIDRILESTITEFGTAHEPPKFVITLKAIRRAARKAASAADRQLEQISLLTDLCEQFCELDFRFLFDRQRHLLSIGFNASTRRLEESYYDLVASEARMTSFLAICHGQLPLEHWFALGRMADLAEGKPLLLSWAGSMFEYLMPMLFMPAQSGTFLAASCRGAVAEQIRHARRLGLPWGISESCYNLTDTNRFYQYRAFGVPTLSVQQKFDGQRVIAPYASAMAVQIAPHEVCENLTRLEQIGCLSSCGFYDALDDTPHRRQADGRPALCRIVMAHHSGMTLLALANALCGNSIQRRFFRDPFCEAHDLLLQERIPQTVKPYKRPQKTTQTASQNRH